MKQLIVAAKDVKVGDRIWWSRYYARDKWIKVTSVEFLYDKSVSLSCEAVGASIWLHREEGIAVQREEAS